jgi:hypothetical protein
MDKENLEKELKWIDSSIDWQIFGVKIGETDVDKALNRVKELVEKKKEIVEILKKLDM